MRRYRRRCRRAALLPQRSRHALRAATRPQFTIRRPPRRWSPSSAAAADAAFVFHHDADGALITLPPRYYAYHQARMKTAQAPLSVQMRA